MSFDCHALAEQVPALRRQVAGHPLAYLDNAATTQKPTVVLEAMDRLYRESYGAVHRSIHTLSREATEAYEGARRTLQRFVGAADPGEIVFCRGTTEALNLLAATLSADWQTNDEILITGMEHHSNIVPWQLACKRTGARLVVAPVTDDGALDLAALEGCIGPRTRAVSVTWVSNALGTVNPIERIVSLAHARDIPVIVDAAQAAPHLDIDVVALKCDFLALSGHKMFGPSGIGILYGRADRLAPLPPWQGGGEMIRSVRFEGTEYADPPARFEAGTPAVAGAVGLAAAADWLTAMDRDEARCHEAELHRHLVEVLLALPDARLVGTAPDRIAVQSFVLPGIDAHELALLADQHGVAVRSGHHCAQPLLERFGLTATVRASLAPYNTHDDIERLAEALTDARSMLG